MWVALWLFGLQRLDMTELAKLGREICSLKGKMHETNTRRNRLISATKQQIPKKIGHLHRLWPRDQQLVQ